MLESSWGGVGGFSASEGRAAAGSWIGVGEGARSGDFEEVEGGWVEDVVMASFSLSLSAILRFDGRYREGVVMLKSKVKTSLARLSVGLR